MILRINQLADRRENRRIRQRISQDARRVRIKGPLNRRVGEFPKARQGVAAERTQGPPPAPPPPPPIPAEADRAIFFTTRQ